MKLQDAYVAESGAMGNWTKIGYAMKQGDSFGYADAASGYTNDGTVVVESLGDDGIVGWTATSKVKLNDCPNASTWTITVTAASSSAQGMVSYATAVTNGSGSTVTGTPCADLTPSFSKLSSNAN